MRRALIIGASIILLVLAALAAYYYFFSGAPGLTGAPSTTLPVAGTATNPIATGTTSDTTGATTDTKPTTPPIATKVTARLVKISAGPVVPGEAIVDVTTTSFATSSTVSKKGVTQIVVIPATKVVDVNVEFIERQSGNIFSYLVRAGTLTRTSNRTLLGIEEAQWLPSGLMAFVRYLSGDTLSIVNTYGIAVDGSGGFFLPQGLADIAVASTSVLALASGANGSVASLMRADGTNTKTVFTSPLSSLRVAYGEGGQYFAFTKPAQSLLGDLFLVDSAGNFSRIAGPLPGLVALPSPSGKEVLISYAQGGVMHTALVHTATQAIIVLPVATIADKCVWAQDDSAVYCAVPRAPSSEYAYPDDWYQGAIPFNDRIWKISVTSRYTQVVLDFSSASAGALDAIALAIDQAGTTLVFVNKNNGSLWSYQL